MFRKYLEGVLGNLWNDFCMYFSRMHSALYRPLQTISKSSTVTCQESVRASESLLWKSKKWIVLGMPLLSPGCCSPCWAHLPTWLLPYVTWALGLPPGAGPEVSCPLSFLLKLTWSTSLVFVWCLLESSDYLVSVIKRTHSNMENTFFLPGFTYGLLKTVSQLKDHVTLIWEFKPLSGQWGKYVGMNKVSHIPQTLSCMPCLLSLWMDQNIILWEVIIPLDGFKENLICG